MLWLPIVYRLAPIMVGTLALNTFVNKSPGRQMGVPMPVLREVAKHAHEVVVKAAKVESRLSRKRMPGTLQLAADYTRQLEYYANAIKEIVRGQIDAETARARFPEILNILGGAQR
jgi:hypothetical protein